MLTEKFGTSGYVTMEMVQDSLGGVEVIIGFFKHALIRRAETNGCVVVTPPVVHFSMPPRDSEWYYREMLEVRVVARVVRVKKLDEQVFSQGAINLC
jgi:hypothetical protein